MQYRLNFVLTDMHETPFLRIKVRDARFDATTGTFKSLLPG